MFSEMDKNDRCLSYTHFIPCSKQRTPMSLSLQLYSLIPNWQINGLLRFMWMIWATINLQACE